jgi:hypothetical protein
MTDRLEFGSHFQKRMRVYRARIDKRPIPTDVEMKNVSFSRFMGINN